jgi:hypothetical protein
MSDFENCIAPGGFSKIYQPPHRGIKRSNMGYISSRLRDSACSLLSHLADKALGQCTMTCR